MRYQKHRQNETTQKVPNVIHIENSPNIYDEQVAITSIRKCPILEERISNIRVYVYSIWHVICIWLSI